MTARLNKLLLIWKTLTMLSMKRGWSDLQKQLQRKRMRNFSSRSYHPNIYAVSILYSGRSSKAWSSRIRLVDWKWMVPIVLCRGMRCSLSVAENYNPADLRNNSHQEITSHLIENKDTRSARRNLLSIGVVHPDVVLRTVDHGASRRGSAARSTDGRIGWRRWKMNITAGDSGIIIIIIITIIIIAGDIIEVLQVTMVNAEPIATVSINRDPLTNIETVTIKMNKREVLCQLVLVDTIQDLVIGRKAILP
jgi:hypothetical protein